MPKPKFLKPLIYGVTGISLVGLVVGLSINWSQTKYIQAVGSSGVKPFIEAFGTDYHKKHDKIEVVVEAYVQAVQSYWDGATLYLADPDGAYLAYSAAISEEDYAKLGVATEYGAGWVGLANGTKVVVTGYKTAWAGEVEIDKGATVEVLADAPTWKAEAVDLTALLGDETLVDYQNKFFTAKDLTVDSAAIYNWDGSGAEGSNSDLYFNVSDGTNVYTFVVESYLCYEGSDVYNAVLALQPGDVIDVEGFLYWYEGANPHITSVTVK